MKPFFQNCLVIGENIDPESYHKQPDDKIVRGDPRYVMSRGELVEFARNPRRWLKGYHNGATDSKDWGAMVDSALLDRTRYKTKYVQAPAMYPCEPTKKDPRTEKPWNNNATFCKEWNEAAEAAGKIPIKAEESAAVQTACLAILSEPVIGPLVTSSQTQVMVVGEFADPNGIVVPLKCLIDLVPRQNDEGFRTALCDFKTATSADPARWPRTAFQFGYHIQGALYMDLWNEAMKEQRDTWLNIVQESFPPYEVAFPIPTLSLEFIEIGRMQYRNALRLYAECLKTGTWPGYPPPHRTWGALGFCEPEPWMLMASAGREIAKEPDPEPEPSEMPS